VVLRGVASGMRRKARVAGIRNVLDGT